MVCDLPNLALTASAENATPATNRARRLIIVRSPLCLVHSRATALRTQINYPSRCHHDPVRPPCPAISTLHPRRLSPAFLPLNARGNHAASASASTSADQGAAGLRAGAGTAQARPPGGGRTALFRGPRSPAR